MSYACAQTGMRDGADGSVPYRGFGDPLLVWTLNHVTTLSGVTDKPRKIKQLQDINGNSLSIHINAQ